MIYRKAPGVTQMRNPVGWHVGTTRIEPGKTNGSAVGSAVRREQMKRIAIAVTALSIGVLLFAAPAAADNDNGYPPSPTVSGTVTKSPTASESVLGKTVTSSPGARETAFTGSDVAGPLALGGALLLLGLGLLYLGRRRAQTDDR